MIFNIQKCSIHDGDGLRTLVFFKGCPLRCKWCANPESQLYSAEIMESPTKCIGCGACMKVCPKGCIHPDEDGYPRIDRNECDNCMACVDRCYAASKYTCGEEYQTEKVFRQIEKDRVFYEIHGGGVTFSGGEPLTHPKDLTAITKKCHENGIHVMLESCGCGSYDLFKEALPYIDGMFMDIKHIDPEAHKELTGLSNEQILENIRKISEFGIPITIRTPVIPGLNDSPENIRGIAEFILTLPTVREYELLAYHQLGVSKYKALSRPYELSDVKPPAFEALDELTALANKTFGDSGVTCFYTRDNTRIVKR